MSSQTGQSVKKKRKPRKYDHSAQPSPQFEESRVEYARRKVIDIDLKKLEQFMWANPTLEMTALFFGVSQETIGRIVKERYALTFDEFRSKNIMVTRKALIQKAVQMALEKDNVAALIFSLKNLAGWSDNVQVQVQPTQTVQLRYSLDAPPQHPDVKDVTPSVPQDPIQEPDPTITDVVDQTQERDVR